MQRRAFGWTGERKASDPEHAVANAAAGDLQLGDGELAEIDALFPPPSSPRSLPML